MDRRQPGYLVPSLRRLEHVYSVAVRNLYSDVSLKEPPNTFFTISIPATPEFGSSSTHSRDRLVYRSEYVPHSVNPIWAPMEWAATASSDHESRLIRTQEVCLRVYAIPCSVMDPYTALDTAPAWRHGQYFPNVEGLRDLSVHSVGRSIPESSSWLQHLGADLLLDIQIEFKALHFLGFDIFSALSSMVPPSAGTKPTVSSDPDIALYQLDTLPLNTVILVLDDGHYILAETARSIRPDLSAVTALAPTPVSSARFLTSPPAPSPSTSQSSLAGKHDLRRGFDGANRLIQLRRDISEAKTSKEGAIRELEMLLSTAEMQDEDNVDIQIFTRALRLRSLRRRRDELQAISDSGELSCAKYSEELGVVVQRLQDSLKTMRAMADRMPAVVNEVESVRGEVTLLKNLMSAKQLSLLAELRALYPIVEIMKNKEYSIRGTKIPDRELQALPDEQISTALGYTCHLVSLLAKYLQVPLRYFPQHMASRSTMRDEIMTGPVEYPLYTKGVEPGMFSNAFFMLQSDVRQLLYSQGISPIDGHILANISRLFTILLDAPLPASTDVIAALDATAGAAAADNAGSKVTPASTASSTHAAP